MGKRPDAADETYEIWAGAAERSDARTSELTGVPRRTIAYWRQHYGWRQRYLSLEGGDADLVARGAVMTMRLGMDAVAARLMAIVTERVPARKADGTVLLDGDGKPVMVWASKDGDAIKASVVLSQYALGPAQQASGPGEPFTASYTVLGDGAPSLPEVDAATAEDLPALRARAAAMLEETAMSVNTRLEPGKKKGGRV